MNNIELEEYKEEYARYLNTFRWESFVTVRTPNVKKEEFFRLTQDQIIQPLSAIVQSQVGGFGIWSNVESNHCHILLSSKKMVCYCVDTRIDYKLLEELKTKAKIKSRNLFSHSNAVLIEPVYDQTGVIDYFIKHIDQDPDKFEIEIYSKKNLRQFIKL